MAYVVVNPPADSAPAFLARWRSRDDRTGVIPCVCTVRITPAEKSSRSSQSSTTMSVRPGVIASPRARTDAATDAGRLSCTSATPATASATSGVRAKAGRPVTKTVRQPSVMK